MVGFSGGVDSTLLAFAAHAVLKERMLAITITTPYIPEWEVEEACAFTKKNGIAHKLISLETPKTIVNNPPERCYLCKHEIFTSIKAKAKELGFNTILDGSNKNDLSDYRPGMRALKELKIVSPMLDLGITKADIREMSKFLNLETWNKPAYACLLSRIPYNTCITDTELQRISEAENVLRDLSIIGSRVRSHGDIARIEVPTEHIEQLVRPDLREQIIQRIKACGYLYVTLDLSGYETGSLNKTINTNHE